jgi:hypothetical protein
MSTDPLPLPESPTASSNQADYQAVYAELTASVRGRSFLAEYARRNVDPDARRLIDTIARLETAMRDNRPAQPPDALLRGLVDVAAAVQQFETLLVASTAPAADELFAAERIQDIAIAIRRRDVEPALCDALEAAAREVGDAIVRNKAAAVAARGATALAQNLARRVKDIIALAAAAGGSNAEPIADRSDDGRKRFDDTAWRAAGESIRTSTPDAVDASTFKDDGVDSPSQIEPMPRPLPDMPAAAGPDEDPGDLFESQPLPELAPRLTSESPAATPVGAGEAEAAGPVSSGDHQPSVLSATRLPEAEAPTKAAAPLPAAPSPPRAVENSAARSMPRAASTEPLAAVLALSEEELIALFS